MTFISGLGNVLFVGTVGAGPDQNERIKMPICKCPEAKVERGIPRSAKVADRKWFHDDELSAVAAAAHDCEYIRWRNSKIDQAEANARNLARQKVPATDPSFDQLVSERFHDEMSRICGTPRYTPETM